MFAAHLVFVHVCPLLTARASARKFAVGAGMQPNLVFDFQVFLFMFAVNYTNILALLSKNTFDDHILMVLCYLLNSSYGHNIIATNPIL